MIINQNAFPGYPVTGNECPFVGRSAKMRGCPVKEHAQNIFRFDERRFWIGFIGSGCRFVLVKAAGISTLGFYFIFGVPISSGFMLKPIVDAVGFLIWGIG